jgi:hypothetical protein
MLEGSMQNRPTGNIAQTSKKTEAIQDLTKLSSTELYDIRDRQLMLLKNE